MAQEITGSIETRLKNLNLGGNIKNQMNMEVNYNTWEESLREFCNRNNLKFKIQSHAPVGYSGKYISFRIQIGTSSNIFEVIQSGQKGYDFIGLNHLYSTIELTTNESIILSISIYEFIDKLLLRHRFKTGSEQFDP